MGSATPSDNDRDRAKERWEADRIMRHIPESVRYDPKSGKVIIEFTNGSMFTVPARALQGLEGASEDDLVEVELLGETGLDRENRSPSIRHVIDLQVSLGSAFLETNLSSVE